MVHKTKKNKTQHRETGNIGYTRRRKTKHNTIQRNWQHRVHKTKKNKTKTTQSNWQQIGTQDKEKHNTTQRNWQHIGYTRQR
jgi:hypothetical protein